MDKLSSIECWAINKIYIDDELEYGDDYYSKDDFLRWILESENSSLEIGKVYLLGFCRHLLCEVVDITSEYCNRGPGYDQTLKSLYLKKLVDLDEQRISIKQVGNNSYLMEVNNENQ